MTIGALLPVAILEGWTVGPFGDDDSTIADDGSLLYSDGTIHPITLRVRAQDSRVVHANNGEVSDMSYRIVPVAAAPGTRLSS